MTTSTPRPQPPTDTPRPPMLSLDDALARLVSATRPFDAADAETVSTFDARGRVLAVDVVSALDVPPADNSAMDGYALCAADVPAPGGVLPVSQRIAAGQAPAPLAAGSAARIFTGAHVPPGADTVVMQEDCTAQPDGSVRVDVQPVTGRSIRRRGEDVRRGATVLAAGIRITPQAMGMAASVGAATLQVARRPRVALFSTGDELAMPDATPPDQLKTGAIYNSNRYVLRGLIDALGCECHDLGIVPDRLDATRAALREAAARADLIVTCGGVSVGEEDHLKPAVAAEGRIDLWQVAIKPGKPLAFGAVRRPGNSRITGDWSGQGSEAAFIGLPGNPVSSFITFLLAVRPVLLRLQGVIDWQPKSVPMRADFDWPRADRRREFLRVRRNATGGLDLYDNQGSGVLTSAVWGDGLVDNLPGQVVRAGDVVRFIAWAELLT